MSSTKTMILPPMPGFTFGCDPELFVLDPNGLAVPASLFIPGSKEEPHPVQYGFVQVDGMAAEFNIDPVDNFMDWDHNIQKVMTQLARLLPEGYSLSIQPSIEFTEENWAKAGEESKVLGCHPDMDAWTGDCNPPPDVGDSRLRCAGGHVHIGWREDADLSDEKHVTNCRDLIKQLDWYVGSWTVRGDDDKIRRSMYGKAGACRYKTYGVEYRTPSNFWIGSKSRRLVMWNRLQAGIWGMRDRYMPGFDPKKWGGPGQPYSNFTTDQINAVLVESINTSKRVKPLEEIYRFPIWDVDQRCVEKE